MHTIRMRAVPQAAGVFYQSPGKSDHFHNKHSHMESIGSFKDLLRSNRQPGMPATT